MTLLNELKEEVESSSSQEDLLESIPGEVLTFLRVWVRPHTASIEVSYLPLDNFMSCSYCVVAQADIKESTDNTFLYLDSSSSQPAIMLELSPFTMLYLILIIYKHRSRAEL